MSRTRPGAVIRVLPALVVTGLVVLVAACTSPPQARPPAGSATPTSAPDTGTAPGSSPPHSTTPSVDGRCSTADRPLDRRVRDLLFVSISRGTAAELDAALTAEVGGVVVTSAAAPLAADGTVAAAVDGLDPPPLVGVDEEGGRVQRLRGAIGPVPSARTMGAMPSEDVRRLARRTGESLRGLGITIDFAPVVDVTDAASGAIGDRSFGGSASEVVAGAEAFALGLLDAGVLPSLKHFPGHGATTGDSHDGRVTTRPIGAMGEDLAPYRELLPRLPATAVMVGHLVVPGLTGSQPATTSPEAINGLLREELGFDGLVISDDLERMDAIQDRYPTSEAAVRAVAAGADMALIGVESIDAVISALHAAIADGRLDEAQVTRSSDRVLAARAWPTCAPGSAFR